jgi:glycosyltransferase involved in cell wall biosynthesis
LDRLLPALPEHGWHPVLGLVEGPRHHRPERYLEVHEPSEWVPIACATGTPEGRARALISVLDELEPDVALSVNVPDLPVAVARMRLRGEGPRVAMTIHGIQPDLYEDVHRFRHVLDGVVATNRLACRLTELLGGMPSSRVHYASYAGVVDGASDRHGQRSDSDVLRVGWAGRLEEFQKRASDVVAIAAALRARGTPFRLLVAGEGPSEDRVRAELRRHGLEEEVRFLGALTKAEMGSGFYDAIDALLITSRWETGPLVAWEAMAAGVPVVSTRYVGSGLEGALVHGETALLFDVGDARAGAERLARLASDRDVRARLVERGRRLWERRYSPAASAGAWAAALDAVTASEPRTTAPPIEDVVRACGRMDRWVGPRLAETVRGWLGRRGPDGGPAGEWPHSYGRTREGAPDFWQRVTAEDERRGETGGGQSSPGSER